ncbi:MAG: DNA polymerase III subunit delta' [Dechloromonas sp.]|nr:DNA polymerase III subunit delta' [Dechloromonas sp.]
MNVIELHNPVWQALQERRQRLPHALLLIGQNGLGKFELARHFAAALLCEAPGRAQQACGTCLACNWFSQGNHPDFRLLQPEALATEGEVEEGKKKPSQQITIDQVRALDEFLGVGSHRGGLRVLIVNPAEAMNRSTANSILKTLEEPPPDTLFLLVSSEPNRLLPTIRSRCQVVPVPVPNLARATSALQQASIADAAHWLALAGGSPRQAIDMATAGQHGWLETLSERLASGAQLDVLALAGMLDKAIKDSKGQLLLKQVIEALQKWLVDLSLLQCGQAARYFLAREKQLAALAAMIPGIRTINLYRAMHLRRQEAEQPLNARLFLEGVLLDYRGLFKR